MRALLATALGWTLLTIWAPSIGWCRPQPARRPELWFDFRAGAPRWIDDEFVLGIDDNDDVDAVAVAAKHRYFFSNTPESLRTECLGDRGVRLSIATREDTSGIELVVDSDSRRITQARLAGGSHRVLRWHWNLRDSLGKRVEPGFYNIWALTPTHLVTGHVWVRPGK